MVTFSCAASACSSYPSRKIRQLCQSSDNLGAQDKMNEYVTHVGGGLFATLAGRKRGEYLGQEVFE